MSQPNSDYYPVLDLGAERRRFRRDHASGFPALSDEWFNLLASLTGRRAAPGGEPLPALPENPRVRARALGALVRSPVAQAASDSLLGAFAHQAIYQTNMWQATLGADQTPSDWELWLEQANQVDHLRNGGTAGTADEPLYTSLARFMDRHKAPQPARDVLAFRHGIASWNFAEANAAADRLMPVVLKEHKWIAPDELRDGLVIRTASPARRGRAHGRRTIRSSSSAYGLPGDLRSLLLGAYVMMAEGMQTRAAARRYAGATLTSTCSS